MLDAWKNFSKILSCKQQIGIHFRLYIDYSSIELADDIVSTQYSNSHRVHYETACYGTNAIYEKVYTAI